VALVIFQHYIARWHLTPDGEPIHTHSSDLLPVRLGEVEAMLKIARAEEEKSGHVLLEWWDGNGAARVLKKDETALLLERASGSSSLSEMVKAGRDAEASRIICTVAAQLHAPRDKTPPPLIPLREWFSALSPAAERHGGVLRASSEVADYLLENPHDIRVLHGDLHHGNVLNTRHRGWIAIDPKRLIGERGYDFANVFCNPDLETATAPGRLARQVEVVARAAELDRMRLLQWIAAYAGLSAAWSLEDGDDATLALTIATLAVEELRQA